MHLFTAAFLLGLAGFDIAGGLLLLAALAAGVPEKQIHLFSAASLFAAVLVGTLLSMGLRDGVTWVIDRLRALPDVVYAWLELIPAALLLGWFVRRVCRRRAAPAEQRSRLTQSMQKGMTAAGLLFAAWEMSDPSFWGVIALASRSGSVWRSAVACAVWMLVGQLPLYLLDAAVALRRHTALLRFWREKVLCHPLLPRLKRLGSALLSAVILLTGAALAANSLRQLLCGRWLF